MNSDDKIKQTSAIVQEKANLIWSIADLLVGLYKPVDYAHVILPMCVIKRFEDTLAPTKAKVLEVNRQIENDGLAVKSGFLKAAAGQKFYNTSEFTFETLLNDPENIKENFESYLNHFSENVADIIHHMKFHNEIDTLADHNRLYLIIKGFCGPNAYLGADKVSSVEMGYIFEELVRKFSEQFDDQAGAHFTARDIVNLMSEMLTVNIEDGAEITANVYDMTMGTSQMLACISDKFREIDPEAEITTYGQELNPNTYAIAKADTLIKGGSAENMKLGDTLGNDQFENYTFDYIISNPPFGIEWKTSKAAVEKEHALGDAGRFPTKLPAIGDGQMLFMLNGVAKLNDNGRMAIIQNGSPLFKGGASSGESEIRGYLLEHDYVEAIVQLPANLFYNTPLTTYIWIISKQKEDRRIGKVQLIDASKAFEKQRKSIGNKSVAITERCRELVMEAYRDFCNREYEIEGTDIRVESRVKDFDDFKYTQLSIQRPLRMKYVDLQLPDTESGIKEADREYLAGVIAAFEKYLNGHEVDDFAFFHMLKQAKIKTPAAKVKLIRKWLGKKDETANPAYNTPTDNTSGYAWDSDLSDTEIIPWKLDREEYLNKNVRPFAPDFEIDETATQIGYEIPMTREFYRYEELRPSAEIFAHLKALETKESELMTKILG